MRIARARDADVPALARMMADSPLLRRYGVTTRGAHASLAESLRDDDLVLVAIDRGIVGLAWVVITRALDRSAYLRLLLVAEGRRSQGVGAALLAAVERRAARMRCRHVALLVTSTNRRARSFYSRHGYARVGTMRDLVRTGIDEVLYIKTVRALQP
jgi:GNAT superfamily N-acetyltransferase